MMAAYSGRGVHGQTVRLLGERVLSGRIGEGETIEVLAAKGRVGSRQKKGTFVRPRTDWNLLDPDVVRWQIAAGAGDVFFQDLAEFRDVLEPAAASLAARRRTDADIAELRAALTDIAVSAHGPADEDVMCDRSLHHADLADHTHESN